MKAEVADDTGCYVIAGLPSTDLQRLTALQANRLLDSGAAPALNELARLAALCCEAPIAMIALSNRHGHTVRPRSGSEIDRREHRLAFCAHSIGEPPQVMVVPDARRDSRFAGNPLVTTLPGIVFIAAAPLVAPTGEAIGALCVTDYSQREFTERQHQMLLGLAVQVMEQLELRANLVLLETKVVAQSTFVGQLKREQQELQKQNGTDPLTGLGNRRSFHDRLCLEIGRAECTGTSAALVMLDVDGFKSYNDSFGHPAGDVVLKQLAKLVLQSCRGEDFAARIGGEEFAVLLPGTAYDEAFVFANWLRRRVERQMWPHRPVTISAGVAVAAGGESGLQLEERADIALYRSKRDGRNRVTMSEGYFAV
ncbi:MAG: sensor domain-containing diguanylate cyclase [Steroidobacteraceae bacterium]